MAANDNLAFKWFHEAAEQGHADAQYCLAQYYFSGKGGEKNDSLALVWLRKTANQGSEEACLLLGDLHVEGAASVEKNNGLALEWYNKVADNRDSATDFHLKQGLDKNYELAMGKIERLANLGDSAAKDLLAENYYRLSEHYFNKDSKEDDNLGFERLTKAIELDNEIALKESGIPHSRDTVSETLQKRLNAHFLNKAFGSARKFVEKIPTLDQNFKETCLTIVDQAEELDKKNQELEKKNKQLQQAEKELEDMMAMFAHKFRSPLDAIIYNTTHENQVKLYTEAAQTMRGLLDIFRIISTNAAELKKGLIADNHGKGNLQSVLDKTLNMILLHLLSNSSRDKIRQHYIAYAKVNGLCEAGLSRREWREKHIKLEQSLQSQWENEFAALLNQSASLGDRLGWVAQHFFALEVKGFDREDVAFAYSD